MSNQQFSGEETRRAKKVADTLVTTALDNTSTPREALLALVHAASTISIVHGIPPKEILSQIFETMSN
jgi:hypothetical protein